MPPIRVEDIMLEDDSINGSVVGKTDSDVSNEQIYKYKPKTIMRDRIIEYILTHEKVQKDELFIHISGSGVCSTIILGLVRAGVIVENKFDCGNCVWYSIDQEKINIA